MTTRSVLLFLFVLGSLMVSGGCTPAPSNGPAVLLERAKLRRNDQKWEESVQLLTEAIAQSPTDASLYYERALTRVAAGQLDRRSHPRRHARAHPVQDLGRADLPARRSGAPLPGRPR